MFSDWDDSIRVPFFYGVTVLAVIMIGFYLYGNPLNFHLTRFGMVMILSGAIGNFLDRVLWGYVIDFIDTEWYIFGWHHDFAIFNVADVAINIGVISILLEIIIRRKDAEVKAIRDHDSAETGNSVA